MAIFGAPSFTPEGDRHVCPLSFFLKKFTSEQLLFEAFFDNDRYFWQHSAQSKLTFPIFVYYNISKLAIFGTPSSSPGGDKETCVH